MSHTSCYRRFLLQLLLALVCTTRAETYAADDEQSLWMKMNHFACSALQGDSLESCRLQLSGLEAEAAARLLHQRALDASSLVYHHQGGFIDGLMQATLRNRADEQQAAPGFDAAAASFLRAVLLFDITRGYLDSDPQGANPKPPANATYRGPRSIALRLEAVRALNRLFSADRFPFEQDELDVLVHDYNPTEVHTTRSDSILKTSRDWPLPARIEMALYAALMHFPNDPEVPALLAQSTADYRPSDGWREGALRFTIVFFVNKVAVYEPALREKLLTALAKEEPLPEDCGDDPSLALLYESLVTLPRSIIYGGFRYLPREQLAAMTYQELRSLASRGRQEAIAACCAAVLPLQIEQYTLQHADPEERLKRALNIRGRWIKRWKRSKEEHAQLCRQLHAVGTAWTAALEHRVVYFAELEGIEDKAFLIASLVHVYEQASPAIVSKYYDQAIERLKGRIVSLDEESLLGQIRVNTLRAALYRHYRRPDGSVDGLLLDRKMKDPPREVADSARERREASEKQLLAELERLLPSRMRRRDRLRLLIELGFSLSDVSELDEKLRSEEDDKK